MRQGSAPRPCCGLRWWPLLGSWGATAAKSPAGRWGWAGTCPAGGHPTKPCARAGALARFVHSHPCLGFVAEPVGPSEFASIWVFYLFPAFPAQVPGNSLAINNLNKTSKSAMVPTELAPNPGRVPAPTAEGLGVHAHGASILLAANGARQEMAEPKLPRGKGHGGRKHFYSLTGSREGECFVLVCLLVCPSLRAMGCHPENSFLPKLMIGWWCL